MKCTCGCSHIEKCTCGCSHIEKCTCGCSHIVKCTCGCSHIVKCTCGCSHIVKCTCGCSHIVHYLQKIYNLNLKRKGVYRKPSLCRFTFKSYCLKMNKSSIDVFFLCVWILSPTVVQCLLPNTVLYAFHA